MLSAQGAQIDNLRIIRDRESGRSKGYAFVNFKDVDSATRWFDKQYNRLQIEGRWIRMEYAKKQAGKEPGDWDCPQCGLCNYKNRTSCHRCGFSDALTQAVVVQDGTRDIGTTPHSILLLRDVPLVDAQALYEQASRFVPIWNARLIHDRKNHKFLGFAFLECKSEQEAISLMSRVHHPTLPKPMVINKSMVSVTFAHVNSFVSTLDHSPWSLYSYLDELGQRLQVAYWDETSYATMYPPFDDKLSKPLADNNVQQDKDQDNQAHVKTLEKQEIQGEIKPQSNASVIIKPPVQVVDHAVDTFYSELQQVSEKKPKKEKKLDRKLDAQLNRWNKKQKELRANPLRSEQDNLLLSVT